MLVSDIITDVKSGTLHDADDQVSAAQYLALVSREYRNMRRWLCNTAPELCEATVTAIAVTTGASIAKTSLTDFEKVVLVSKLEGTHYFPIAVDNRSAVVSAVAGELSGTYQVTYLAGAPSSITTSTAIDLPAGLDAALTEKCCAWVCQRMGDRDPKYHRDNAAAIMREASQLLQDRQGRHIVPGLVVEYLNDYVWFETPTTLELRKRWDTVWPY